MHLDCVSYNVFCRFFHIAHYQTFNLSKYCIMFKSFFRTILKQDGSAANCGSLTSEVFHRPWADIGSNHTAISYK